MSVYRRALSTPGLIATGLVILTTTLWTYWGAAEMYYEGWGAPFPAPLAYLIPAALCLALTLIALKWPRLGGWILIVLGVAFTLWWTRLAAGRGWLSWRWLLSTFPVSGLMALTGALFLAEWRYRQRQHFEEDPLSKGGLSRTLPFWLAIGVPGAVLVGVSVYYLPTLLGRVDDGLRGARLIEGNGVTLIWAPEGPGWNWVQPFGGYPSWDSIARYGQVPVGLEGKSGGESGSAAQSDMQATNLCRYLDASGAVLMKTPQDIWRMPSVEELVRSLPLHGNHAGCTWQGEAGQASCQVQPDKETPLWAPDQPAIYYWAADDLGNERAWYVSYNGFVGNQPKRWGNPRHGYRCVREP